LNQVAITGVHVDGAAISRFATDLTGEPELRLSSSKWKKKRMYGFAFVKIHPTNHSATVRTVRSDLPALQINLLLE
jgi:hypothetical protein